MYKKRIENEKFIEFIYKKRFYKKRFFYCIGKIEDFDYTRTKK